MSGSGLQIDTNLNCVTFPGNAATLSTGIAAAVAGGPVVLEQTLDTIPLYATQTVNVCRQIFKGGVLKIAIKIKGWEMPGGWKAYCQSNLPQIMSPQSQGG